MKIKQTHNSTTFYLDKKPSKSDAKKIKNVFGGSYYEIKTVEKTKKVYKLTIYFSYRLSHDKKHDNAQYWQAEH